MESSKAALPFPVRPNQAPGLSGVLSRPIQILSALGVVGLSYFASDVLIPIVAAVFLFFLIEPLVKGCEKRRISRLLSSPTLVVVGVVRR